MKIPEDIEILDLLQKMKREDITNPNQVIIPLNGFWKIHWQ